MVDPSTPMMWLQRRLRTVFSFAQEHTSLYYVVVNQILLSIGSAGIVVLLARFNSPERFGEIRYLIALFAILSFWSLPGISQVLSHSASTITQKGYWAMIRSQYAWGAGSILGSVLVACYHYSIGQYELGLACVIGGLITPLSNLYLVPGLVLAGIKAFKIKIVVDVGIVLSALVGATFGGILFNSASGIIILYLGSQAATTLLALMYVAQKLPKTHTTHIHQHRKAYADSLFGRQLTLIQFPLALLPAIEKILVFIVLGPLALATYVIATLPIEHFKTAYKNLLQFYILPHIQQDEQQRPFETWLVVASILGICGGITLLFFVEYIMPQLFATFTQVAPFARILLLSIIAYPTLVCTIYWVAIRNMRALQTYSQIATIAHILIMISLAVPFGLTGVIWAKIINELSSGIIIVAIDRMVTDSES